MPSGSSGAENDPSNPLTATEVENQVPTIDAPMTVLEKIAVPIVFTIFVVFRAADRVFMKNINNDLNLSQYNLTFTSIIWPAAMQVITFCIIFGYVMKQRLGGNTQYNCSFFKLNQPLASSTGPIPTYMLALFSLGDQLNAAMSAPASPFVSQPIQSVMTNFILIWMAFIAYFWISVRYKLCHYAGMALVIASVLVQFSQYVVNNNCSPIGLDAVFQSDCAQPTDNQYYNGTDPDGCTHFGVQCFSAYHSPTSPDATNYSLAPTGRDPEYQGGQWVKQGAGAMAFFYILFVISTLPAAVSNVYKQKVLQGVDADIFYVTWWSGWFQLLWGWVCIPLMWIPLPGQDTLAPQDTFAAIAQTFRCISGVTHMTDELDVPSCGSTPPLWMYVILYFAFNATFNLCITWLILRISATWVQVATVLCLNLCNVLSTQTWLVGSSAEPMTAYDWAAAVIVSFALVVYNLQPEVTADGKEMLQQGNGSFVADGHANLIEKLSGTTPKGSFVKPGSFVGKD